MNDHERDVYYRTGRRPERELTGRIPRRERWGLLALAAAWIALMALLRALGVEW